MGKKYPGWQVKLIQMDKKYPFAKLRQQRLNSTTAGFIHIIDADCTWLIIGLHNAGVIGTNIAVPLYEYRRYCFVAVIFEKILYGGVK